jgi:putative transposase
MARKRHSPESIAAVLRRVEAGVPIAELARKAGVHENTIHLWKKKYGRLGIAEIREINELRDENTRLKRLVADLTLDKVMLQDVLSKSSKAGQAASLDRRSSRTLRREPTAHLHNLSIQSQIDPLPTQAQSVQRSSAPAHQRTICCARALRPTPDPCPVTARRMGGQSQAGSTIIPPRRLEPTGKSAKASPQLHRSERTACSDSAQSRLEYGLYARSFDG